MTYILLDTETTGAEQEDRICQLAFIAKTKNDVKFYMDYCKPPLPIKFGAMSVNHITNEFIADFPEYNLIDSAKKLNELNNENSVLVIHNAKFDLDMLEKEGFVLNMPLIDTYRCIRHLEPDLDSHALQYLRYALGFYKQEGEFAKKLGVDIKAHDALGDVIVLNFLMSYLVKILDSNKNKIAKLIELTNQPILIKTFRFGKHKGKKIKDVAVTDKSYLEWAIKNMDMDEDLRFSIEDALG